MEYYNNEFKQAFLNNEEQPLKKSAHASCKSLFKNSIKKETKLNKDLYNFSTEEIAEVFSEAGWINASLVDSYKSCLKKYFLYAASKHLIPASNVSNTTRLRYTMINRTDTIKDTYYKTYNDFIAEFERLFNSTSVYKDYYITLRVKCLLSLAWFGVHPDDLISVTIADINIKEKTIHSKTLKRYVPIPDSVIDLCINLANITVYEDMLGKPIILPNNNTIIKVRDIITAVEENSLTLKCIMNNFKRDYINQIKKHSNNKEELEKFVQSLKLKKAAENGQFERAYQYEKANGEFKNNKDYGKIISSENKSTITKAYWLYKDWKNAMYSDT